MQVSSSASASQYLQNGKLGQLADNRQANARAQIEKDANSLARQNRFEIDQQAIAMVEQGDRLSTSPPRNNTAYDQPSQQNRSAVALYQSIDNQTKRDQVQNMLGVDLFA